MRRAYHHWSVDDVVALHRLYMDEMLPRGKVAERLGVSVYAVRAKLSQLGLRHDPAWQPRQRVSVVRYRLRCLVCGEMFWSRDKARQRICSPCKTRETWQCADAETVL